MRRYDIWLGFVWVALGVFVSLFSYHLGLGNIRNPGIGLFPFCLGVLFLIIAMAVLIKTLLGPKNKLMEGHGTSKIPYKAIAALVALLGFAVLLEVLGYYLTTFLTLTALFRIGGYKKMIHTCGYAVIIVTISYVLFAYLGVRFPPGVFRYLGLG